MDALEEKVVIKAELNPGCLLEWLSVVDGKKTGTKRSELSGRVKRHLSALGWTFSYQPKKKREMRFKSPTGRWYYSLATACKACVHQDGFNQHQPQDRQHAPQQHQQHQPQQQLYQHPQQQQSQQLQYQPQQLQYQPQPQQYQQQQLQYQSQTQQYRQQQLHYQPQTQRYQQQQLHYQPQPQQYQQQQQPQQYQPQQYQPQQLQYQHQPQQQYVPTFDLSCYPRNIDESNQRQTKDEEIHRVEDCDIVGSTPNEEILSSDSIQIVPSFDISHHQHKRKRLKSSDTKGSTSSDEENPLAILPCYGVSNQQPKKKNSDRVKDCDTAAFNKVTPNEEKRRSSDSIDAPNQQQKKRRNTRTAPFSSSTLDDEDKAERRPGKGKRLMKILQAMKKKEYIEKESERLRKDCGPDMNCEVCCVCHWGEDLLRCNGCPSAFHITCLGLSALPQEEFWFCPCCCCNICGSMDSPGNSMLMTCQQCQRRFHLKCSEDEPYIVSRTDWFCSSQCYKVFGKLMSLLKCEIAIGDGDLVWKLMRAPNEDEHYDHEQISKLNSTVQIFHQGFDLTEDPLSGRDLVEELIFTRDETGATCGCYMVLIEKNNEPIMVAALRVEKHVAEIPLMATLPNHKTTEMCTMFMDELEKQMSQMGVHRLVLPVEKEGLATWTEQFGFSVMESSEKLEFVKHGMHEFVGTLLCYKILR